MLASTRAHTGKLIAIAAVLFAVTTSAACTSDPSSSPTPGQSQASVPTSGSGGASASPPTSGSLSPVSRTVAPPSSGNVGQTVATRAPVVLPKVSLTRKVAVATGVTMRVARVRAVNAVSRIPGEVNGPAVEVTVAIANSTAKRLNVASASVNLADSQGDPGITVTTSSSRMFSGSVKPGDVATGVYVFRVPVSRRDPVSITANVSGGGRMARFVGTVK